MREPNLRRDSDATQIRTFGKEGSCSEKEKKGTQKRRAQGGEAVAGKPRQASRGRAGANPSGTPEGGGAVVQQGRS